MPETTPSFFTRLGLALRLLFDGAYAATLLGALRDGAPVLAEPVAAKPAPELAPAPVAVERDLGPALQVLELLQREGRLVDFLRQDIVSFADADVGAAARIVHQGCRHALERVASIERIRPESEGAAMTLDAGFDSKSCRLVGNVQGSAPYRGTLKHPGWRVTRLTLEEPLPGADLHVLAAAEVEL